MIEQTDKVENDTEKLVCLQAIIPSGLINRLACEQSIKHIVVLKGLPKVSGGVLYGQDDELDTSSWVKFDLVATKTNNRPLSILSRRVRGTVGILNIIDGVHIWIQSDRCKILNNTVFNHSKPREVTAYGVLNSTRTQSHRSTLINKNQRKGDRFCKLVELKTFRRYLSLSHRNTGGIFKGPDSTYTSKVNPKLAKRAYIPVSS